MNIAEYRIVRDFIKDKSLKLMSHEKRALQKQVSRHKIIRTMKKEGKKYYLPKTNTFKHIITNVLADACEKFSNYFGTGNANDVIEAIYEIDRVIFSLEDFAPIMAQE